MSKEREAKDWYDYHETQWETLAVIQYTAIGIPSDKCHLVNVLAGSSHHVIEQTLKAKGYDLSKDIWYRTEKR